MAYVLQSQGKHAGTESKCRSRLAFTRTAYCILVATLFVKSFTKCYGFARDHKMLFFHIASVDIRDRVVIYS